MARINIEECWWSDPRRTKLLLKIGFAADAAAINMWRVAQEYWANGYKLVPKATFDALEFASDLLGVGLAEVQESGVYVRGSSDYLDWLNAKRTAGRLGGEISAKRPRDEKGRLLPKQDPSTDPSKTNHIQPSGSGSGSGSREIQNSNTISTVVKNLTPAPVGGGRKGLVEFIDQQSLIAAIDRETLSAWIELYPDETFRSRELLKAFRWYRDNPKKLPRTVRGWKRALSTWFERSWPRHVAQMPGQSRPPSISEILAESERDHA